jgi:hypothetical protein
MKRSSASARYTLIVLCLLLASGLTACGTSYVRPDSAPMAPGVDCALPALPMIPPIPEMAQAAEWMISVMGLIERDRAGHAAHEDCMRRLRDEGVIR